MSSKQYRNVVNGLIRCVETTLPINDHFNYLYAQCIGTNNNVTKMHPTEIKNEILNISTTLKHLSVLDSSARSIGNIINKYGALQTHFKLGSKTHPPACYLYIEFKDVDNTFIKVKLFDKWSDTETRKNSGKVNRLLNKFQIRVCERLGFEKGVVYGPMYQDGNFFCKVVFDTVPNKTYKSLTARRVKFIVKDLEKELLTWFGEDKELEWVTY